MKKKIAVLMTFACILVFMTGCRIKFSVNDNTTEIDFGEFFETVAGASGSSNETYENADKYSVGDAKIKEKVNRLDVSWICSSVTIESTPESVVTIKEVTNKQVEDNLKVHWYLDEEGTLFVKFAQSGKVKYQNLTKDITISIPENYHPEELIVNSSSADISISDIKCEKAHVESSSGNIYLNNEDVRKFTIVSSSGNINLDSDFEEADISSSSGDIAVNTKNITRLDIETSSGNADIQMNDFETCEVTTSSGWVNIFDEGNGKELKISTNSGDIQAELGEVTEIKATTSSGSMSVSANGVEKLITDSTSGNQYISFNSAPKEVGIESSSGEISLTIPENVGYNIEYKSSSGDYISSFRDKKLNGSWVYGNEKVKIDVETTSGNLYVYQGDDTDETEDNTTATEKEKTDENRRGGF